MDPPMFDDLQSRLQQSLQLTCGQCGEELSQGVDHCSACGAPVDEEENFAFAVDRGGERTGVKPDGAVALEQSKNYVLMKHLVDGMLAGTISEDDCRVAFTQIKALVRTGLTVLQSDVARARFADLPVEQKLAMDTLEQGFETVGRGVARLETCIGSRNPDEIRDGWEETERGLRAVEKARDTAVLLKEDA